MLSLLYIDHLLAHIAAAAALYHRRQGHTATLNVFLHIYDRLVRVDLTAEPLTSIRRDMPGYTGNCRACYGGKDFSHCCFATHPRRTSSCAQLRGSGPAPISMCSASRISTCLQWPEVRQSHGFPKSTLNGEICRLETWSNGICPVQGCTDNSYLSQHYSHGRQQM